jgi:hypothetical protein
MCINPIIIGVRNNSTTFGLPPKHNLPPWWLWLILKKYRLKLCRKKKWFIKFMQYVTKICKQKTCVISFIGGVASIVIPIFHPIATKQHNWWSHWTIIQPQNLLQGLDILNLTKHIIFTPLWLLENGCNTKIICNQQIVLFIIDSKMVPICFHSFVTQCNETLGNEW